MIEQLKNIGTERVFPKRSFLFRQGEKAGNFFIVQQGLVKAYYETLDGNQFVKSFIREGGFIASMQAIVAGKPNSFTTLCLEESKVLEVPKSGLLGLLATQPQFVEVLNSLLLGLGAKKEQREYELLCLSAEERYLLLCSREPELIKRLSQEDIARYLGLTPVSLSRIRKRCRIRQQS